MESGEAAWKGWDTFPVGLNTFPILWEHIPSGAGAHSQWCGNTFPVGLEHIPSAGGIHSQWNTFPVVLNTFPVRERGTGLVIHPQALPCPAQESQGRAHSPPGSSVFQGFGASPVCTPGVKSDLQKRRLWGGAALQQLQGWCWGFCASKTSTGAGAGAFWERTIPWDCSGRAEGKAEAALPRDPSSAHPKPLCGSSEPSPCSSQGVLLAGRTQNQPPAPIPGGNPAGGGWMRAWPSHPSFAGLPFKASTSLQREGSFFFFFFLSCACHRQPL